MEAENKLGNANNYIQRPIDITNVSAMLTIGNHLKPPI